MSYSIVYTPFFEREFKKLFKRYISLKKDLDVVIDLLNENPRSGESIGNDCYKIRMAISSKNKGKSGGARLITFVKFVDEEIHLLAIYDKSDLSNIAEDQLLIELKVLSRAIYAIVMECALCKVGITKKGTVTITLERNRAIVLIKDVPAEICTNCGHYYLSEEITRVIMAKGNEAVANGAELEVLSLKVAS